MADCMDLQDLTLWQKVLFKVLALLQEQLLVCCGGGQKHLKEVPLQEWHHVLERFVQTQEKLNAQACSRLTRCNTLECLDTRDIPGHSEVSSCTARSGNKMHCKIVCSMKKCYIPFRGMSFATKIVQTFRDVDTFRLSNFLILSKVFFLVTLYVCSTRNPFLVVLGV